VEGAGSCSQNYHSFVGQPMRRYLEQGLITLIPWGGITEDTGAV
jgi:hypothetical protein